VAGAIESPYGHLKDAIGDALLLRRRANNLATYGTSIHGYPHSGGE
jgi:hypothetical protein